MDNESFNVLVTVIVTLVVAKSSAVDTVAVRPETETQLSVGLKVSVSV